MLGKRKAIHALHRAKKSDSAITKTLSIARSTVWQTLKRFKERGDLSDRLTCGTLRSQRSKSMIKCIWERIRRNPRRSIRLLAKIANMSPGTLKRTCAQRPENVLFHSPKKTNLSLSKACGKIQRNANNLKRSQLRAWQEILQEQLRASAERVHRRLQAVINCKGGHFE